MSISNKRITEWFGVLRDPGGRSVIFIHVLGRWLNWRLMILVLAIAVILPQFSQYASTMSRGYFDIMHPFHDCIRLPQFIHSMQPTVYLTFGFGLYLIEHDLNTYQLNNISLDSCIWSS